MDDLDILNQTSGLLPLDPKYFYYLRYVSSDANVKIFIFVFSYLSIPVISLFGIIGNAMTLSVLIRHGFRKSYNIFILALAIADTLFLVGVNNIPRILLLADKFGFFYTRAESLTLYVVFIVQIGMELNGKYMSMIIPTFVAVERFVAVYFPLHLKSLITCRRARLAVSVLFVSWIPANIYFFMLMRFDYLLNPVSNTSVGYIMRSDLMLNHANVYKVISGFFFMISGPIPVIVVTAFCVAIGVKIQSIKNQRRHLKNYTTIVYFSNYVQCAGKNATLDIYPKNEHITYQQTPNTKYNCEKSSTLEHRNEKNIKFPMTSNGAVKIDHRQKESVSQTTITLFSMCVVYAVIVTASSLPSIILNRNNWESDTGALVELSTQLAVCINCSSNFLIYVTMNKSFRTTLKQILSFTENGR
uniref:G-protein coupled receptors family 1 profile domain-containing protein n=1 Tax=Biomphalaria glabrata TaxID=6526 RepID=A0A2C9KTN9_BIOGL